MKGRQVSAQDIEGRRPIRYLGNVLLHLVVFRNFCLEYALRVLVRLSSVHRDRLSQPYGMTELSCKDVSLNVPWRIVIVVIETNLAPSYIAGMSHGFKAVVARMLSRNTRKRWRVRG